MQPRMFIDILVKPGAKSCSSLGCGYGVGEPSPGGTNEAWGFSRPSGTLGRVGVAFPAMNRWAIVASSLRDDSTRIPRAEQYCGLPDSPHDEPRTSVREALPTPGKLIQRRWSARAPDFVGTGSARGSQMLRAVS